MIQDHPFRADPNPTSGNCVFPIARGGVVVHCGKPKSEHTSSEEFASRANPDFDFDLTYYLSGPMSGYAEHNFPAFSEAAAILRNTGIKIVSPHETPVPDKYHTLSEEEDKWKLMVDLDIASMKENCKGIIMLRGWPQSLGAIEELKIALSLGFPVWYFDNFQLVNMNKVS